MWRDHDLLSRASGKALLFFDIILFLPRKRLVHPKVFDLKAFDNRAILLASESAWYSIVLLVTWNTPIAFPDLSCLNPNKLNGSIVFWKFASPDIFPTT